MSEPHARCAQPVVEPQSLIAQPEVEPSALTFADESSVVAQSIPARRIQSASERVYDIKVARSLDNENNFIIVVREVNRRYESGATPTQSYLFFAYINTIDMYRNDPGHTLWNSRNVYDLINAMLESREYEIKRERGIICLHFDAQIIVAGKCIVHDLMIIRCHAYRIGAEVSYQCD